MASFEEFGRRLRNTLAEISGVVGSCSLFTIRIVFFAAERIESALAMRLTPAFASSGRVSGKFRQKQTDDKSAENVGVFSVIEIFFVSSTI